MTHLPWNQPSSWIGSRIGGPGGGAHRSARTSDPTESDGDATEEEEI